MILFAAALAGALAWADGDSRLINGEPVQPGSYREVVRITTGSSGCTATVVGPRTIVTAAHCAATGSTSRFTIDGKTYQARITRSPDYNDSTTEYDVALGVTSEDIRDIDYATLGGSSAVGKAITLLGYGCTKAGGGGGNDGVLRIGESVITELRNSKFGSRKPGGATLCMGDSGGPAFVFDGAKRFLLGINSTVTIDFVTSYNARIDLDRIQTFARTFAQSNGVRICGINMDCSGGGSEGPPSCDLSAIPSTVNVGEPVTFHLASHGAVTGATIGGTAVAHPQGTLVVTPSATGIFQQTAEVVGPGGTGTCQTTYEVRGPIGPGAPTCTLVASPPRIQLGQSLSLTLQVNGAATSAAIDGQVVAPPTATLWHTPTASGQHVSTAIVAGPGGSGECRATYQVDEHVPQPVPELALVPTYCGNNEIAESPVARACLSVLKRSEGDPGGLAEAVLVTYRDGSEEVLPIAHRNRESASLIKLTLYANSAVKQNGYWMLDSRTGKLTVMSSGGSEVPQELEARSVRGHYFLVRGFASP